MSKKEWEKYLLWGLALLSAGGVTWFIWDDQKKKKLGTGGGTGTAPTHAPLSPPPPPPSTLPTTPSTTPFGQGGTPVSFPVTGSGLDTFMQQAQAGTSIMPGASVFTVQTSQTGAAGALRSHVLPDVNAPVNGSFGHGAQVTSVDAPQTSADGRVWQHVSGTDAQTNAPLLGWVDASYLGA
jgi:hypothetical protein